MTFRSAGSRFIDLPASPLAPGAHPVRIHYREFGAGVPLLFLHGGWGYEMYPFDRQIAALQARFRIIVPDRSGYGRSPRIGALPADFHDRAATETIALLDALGIGSAVLWGHSDGAVIALKLALRAPERCHALVGEATHYYRLKPGSREFFEGMMRDPDGLGMRVAAVLAGDHGEDYWRDLLRMNGRAWVAIAAEAKGPRDDLYGGRLSGLATPTVLVHGSRDPRTEPDELDAIRRAAPHVSIHVIGNAGHSPHSEGASADETTRAARTLLEHAVQ